MIFEKLFELTKAFWQKKKSYELGSGKQVVRPKTFLFFLSNIFLMRYYICSYTKVLNVTTPNKSSSSQVGTSTRRSVAPTAYENC